MRAPGFLCVVAVSSTWLLACSLLFDADRAQCDTAADCAALGAAAPLCVDGLCALEDDSAAQGARDGDSAGRDGESAGGDGDSTGGDGASSAGDGASEPGDAGSTAGDGDGDVETRDGGVGPRPPADCPAHSESLLFCDGFEAEFAAWQRESDTDTRLSIVTDGVARGAHALEAETLVRGDLWAEVRATFPGVRAEPLWVRAFLWAYGDMDFDAVTVLRVESAAESAEGIDLSLQGGTAQAALFAEFGGAERELVDTHRFPVDVWTCVELAFTPGLLGGTASLYVDGRLAATLETRLPGAALEVVRSGVFFTSDEQRPVAVRVDAVAVSTARIGCD